MPQHLKHLKTESPHSQLFSPSKLIYVYPIGLTSVRA